MEFKLIEEKDKVNIYENGLYRVIQLIYADEKYRLMISKIKDDDFVPVNIFPEMNMITGEIISFTIQTIGCRSLTKSDVNKLIEGYEKALKTVEELEKLFLKTNRYIVAIEEIPLADFTISKSSVAYIIDENESCYTVEYNNEVDFISKEYQDRYFKIYNN